MWASIKRLFFLFVLVIEPAFPIFFLVWALAIPQPFMITALGAVVFVALTSLVAEHIVRFSNASSEVRYGELDVIRKKLWCSNINLKAKVLVTAGKYGKVEYFRSFFSDGLIVIDISVLNSMTFDQRIEFFERVVKELGTGKVFLRTVAVIWKKVMIRSFSKSEIDFGFGSVRIKRLAPLGFLRLMLSYPWIYLIDRAYFAFDGYALR